MKIRVIGWYGENNLGDDHFRSVFTDALGVPVTFAQRADDNSDLLIFGGGGVACCEYLTNLKSKPGRKIAVGVDIASTGKEWNRLCQSGFEKVWIRSNRYFLDVTNRQPCAGQPEFAYTPDIAFWDHSKVKHQPVNNTIGVILTQEVVRDFRILKNLSSALNRLRIAGFKIEFLSYYRGKACWDDTATMSLGLHNEFKADQLQCFHTDNPVEMIEKISSYKLLITMRFHGAIHATMAHTPFLSLANPGKHSLFCEQEGLSCFEAPPATNLLPNALQLLADSGMSNRLKLISENNHRLVSSVFAEVKTYL